jgi:hypothetical protein
MPAGHRGERHQMLDEKNYEQPLMAERMPPSA